MGADVPPIEPGSVGVGVGVEGTVDVLGESTVGSPGGAIGAVGGAVAVGAGVGAGVGAAVVAGAIRPASAVRSANAKPKPTRDATMSTATAATGWRQRGVVAIRVRAAEPQSRHQS